MVPLDLEKQPTIEQAGETIRQNFGRVDVLLNVAGILGDGVTTSGPERSILKMDRQWIETTMAVNVIGPVMLIKELVPIMKTKQSRDGRPTSIVANLSARVGSIADNELGGWYSYRFSKAALNQATRTMAHELKRQGTWSVALHPGTTNTDLSQPFQKNVADGRLFPVDFTAKQLLDVIDSMQEEHTGGLYDWSGKALPF
jgi:NAD(P)-dependent dehydrogenase (short-subunit alcohol dehydrogenase family)